MNNESKRSESRRDFVAKSMMGAGGLALGFPFTSAANALFQDKKVGIAVMGLGYYGNILSEALQETKTAYLAGVVSGTPDKVKKWKSKYQLKDSNIYNYENFDSISKNSEIDVVYIALPNSMHKEYTIRAAQAGKHVICEKPMALNPKECEEMIRACEKAGVELAIGYRMHHEPTTQEVMRFAREKVFGNIKYVSASAGFTKGGCDWKCEKKMGGGVMMDMGVYSLQAARYATGEEPSSVTAQTFTRRPEMFKDVDETTTFQLEFPGGAFANLQTTFYTNINALHVVGEKGWYKVDPFSSYSGIKGITSQGVLDFPVINQQAAQMDHVAESILAKKPMLVPGEEGLKDMIVVEAIYKSIATGKKITFAKS